MGTPKDPQWIACVFLEVTFFVNAAGLFFLSALIEKNQNAKVKISIFNLFIRKNMEIRKS